MIEKCWWDQIQQLRYGNEGQHYKITVLGLKTKATPNVFRKSPIDRSFGF